MHEAIVLAGGFGTRLREVLPDLPKPMAPVAGRPFLEILLTSLADKGFSRVVLSLGYMADKIITYFGNSFTGLDLIYVVEDEPLGTGGAVRLALSQCLQDHIYILNGDTFLDLEVDAVEAKWAENSFPMIVARQVPDTARYGRLLIESERAIGFTEKGILGPGLINAGCYILGNSQLNDFALNQPFSLETDFFVQAVKLNRIDVFVTKGYFIDIGIPEDYQRAQKDLANYYNGVRETINSVFVSRRRN